MPAALTDKFTDTFNSANPNVARVTAARTAGGTTLTCDNLAGWPTATKVHFSTYQLNTSNEVVSGSQIDWTGIVSANTVGSLTRLAGATDAGSSIGDVVEMNPTGYWGHDLYTGLTAEHNTNGTHAAVTTTSITNAGNISQTDGSSITDNSGNELIKLAKTASAVNEVTVTNAATGNAPAISATGGDTNIALKLSGKGTGAVQMFVNGTDQLGAWTSWTPTYTNLTVGNGTHASKYSQIGKTVTARVDFTFGTTSSMGSGIVTFTLPVTAASLGTSTRIGQGLAINSGTAEYSCVVEYGTTTTGNLLLVNAAGTIAQMAAFSSTSPFTWTTGSRVSALITYEAA